jgi:hypothetical protein
MIATSVSTFVLRMISSSRLIITKVRATQQKQQQGIVLKGINHNPTINPPF